jgi:hypothetical protein
MGRAPQKLVRCPCRRNLYELHEQEDGIEDIQGLQDGIEDIYLLVT